MRDKRTPKDVCGEANGMVELIMFMQFGGGGGKQVNYQNSEWMSVRIRSVFKDKKCHLEFAVIVGHRRNLPLVNGLELTKK